MDDNQLIHGTFARQQKALAQMKALGVQFVRVTLLWSDVANGAIHRRHFNPANPATYPPHNWDPYDNLVQTVARYGMGVYFDVTGPGPSWAMGHPPRRDRKSAPTWMPNGTQFFRFVYAVGKRYSGRYRKEIGTHPVLPRVRFWSIWNEPNQGGWLTPQSYYSPIAHQVIPYSPILYRQLYYMGHSALVASGHGSDAILIGETAPDGHGPPSTRNPLTPTQFIRELMCVGLNGVPYSGVQAQARDCSLFKRMGPLPANGWAHHPYTLKVPPTGKPPAPGDIVISNISDLTNLLDQLAATTGHIASGLPIFSTEFGYESNPPDIYHGIPLDKQAAWSNLGDFLAFLNPRIDGQTQFLLQDVPPNTHHTKGSKAYWDTYQSGLLYANGRTKPAFTAYRLPLVLYKSGTDPSNGAPQLAYWGQLRFLAHTPLSSLAGDDQVQLQYLPVHTSTWLQLGAPIQIDAVTDFQQFFYGTIDVPGPGQIRVQWKAHMPPYVVTSLPVAVPYP
jgi:hypothetical protein